MTNISNQINQNNNSH